MEYFKNVNIGKGYFLVFISVFCNFFVMFMFMNDIKFILNLNVVL